MAAPLPAEHKAMSQVPWALFAGTFWLYIRQSGRPYWQMNKLLMVSRVRNRVGKVKNHCETGLGKLTDLKKKKKFACKFAFLNEKWRNSLVVKHNGCICRGPTFHSQHRHGGSYLSRIQHPLLASMGTAHTWGSDIHADKNTDMH